MKRGNGVDYKTVENGLMRAAISVPSKSSGFGGNPFSRLKSRNFMTPDVVQIRQLKSNGIWFELSYGTGFSDDYIFGVTFMSNTGESFNDLSECVYEFSEVEELLEKANQLERGYSEIKTKSDISKRD